MAPAKRWHARVASSSFLVLYLCHLSILRNGSFPSGYLNANHSDLRAVVCKAAQSEAQSRRSPLDSNCRVLVVGASRGIGLEFARQIAKRGCKVVATHRPDCEGGLTALASQHQGQLQLLPLDVSNEASVQSAAHALETQYGGAPCLTHIIHSAGIVDYDGWELRAVNSEQMMKVLEVNVVGPTLVAKHFTRLLASRGGGLLPPVLALVSSKVGSISDNGSGGGYAYRASKAALNMVAKSLEVDLREVASVVLLHPGFVRTAMTQWQGLISVTESVDGMLLAIEATDASVDFRWVDYKGDLVPW